MSTVKGPFIRLILTVTQMARLVVGPIPALTTQVKVFPLRGVHKGLDPLLLGTSRDFSFEAAADLFQEAANSIYFAWETALSSGRR